MLPNSDGYTATSDLPITGRVRGSPLNEFKSQLVRGQGKWTCGEARPWVVTNCSDSRDFPFSLLGGCQGTDVAKDFLTLGLVIHGCKISIGQKFPSRIGLTTLLSEKNGVSVHWEFFLFK